MANGVAGKFQTLLGLTGVIALGVTASLMTGVNPVDYVGDALRGALDKLTGNLAKPEPRWSERVGGPPVAAAVTENQVVVVLNGAVEARSRSDGSKSWSRTVKWAVPVGEVVVTGRTTGGGFEVLDTDTGVVRWRDTKASDVWPYQDEVLSVSCRDSGGCTLRARSASDGATQWRRKIDGSAQRLAGYPELDDVVDRYGMLPPDYPGAMPRLVGVVADRQVTVVDTRNGTVRGHLPENATTRVTMVGDRVLGVVAKPTANGGCRYTVRAWNPSGAQVWRRAGYDFGTVSGSGCEQRIDPMSVGGVVAAVRSDDRPVLLGVRGGEIRWSGKRGETVVATNGSIAVVRSANGRQLSGVNVETGDQLWRRTADEKAEVRVTDDAVLVVDTDAETVTAISPGSGSDLRRWESRAKLVGAGEVGIVLSSGRTVGYATW